MKKIVYTLPVMICIVLVTALVYSLSQKEIKTNDCGIVIKKIDALEANTYKGHTDITAPLYMDWKRDADHKYYRDEVDPDTYYKFDVGERICFIKKDDYYGWAIIFAIVDIILIVIFFNLLTD